jgi:hypothetical protein
VIVLTRFKLSLILFDYATHHSGLRDCGGLSTITKWDRPKNGDKILNPSAAPVPDLRSIVLALSFDGISVPPCPAIEPDSASGLLGSTGGDKEPEGQPREHRWLALENRATCRLTLITADMYLGPRPSF